MHTTCQVAGWRPGLQGDGQRPLEKVPVHLHQSQEPTASTRRPSLPRRAPLLLSSPGSEAPPSSPRSRVEVAPSRYFVPACLPSTAPRCTSLPTVPSTSSFSSFLSVPLSPLSRGRRASRPQVPPPRALVPILASPLAPPRPRDPQIPRSPDPQPGKLRPYLQVSPSQRRCPPFRASTALRHVQRPRLVLPRSP